MITTAPLLTLNNTIVKTVFYFEQHDACHVLKRNFLLWVLLLVYSFMLLVYSFMLLVYSFMLLVYSFMLLFFLCVFFWLPVFSLLFFLYVSCFFVLDLVCFLLFLVPCCVCISCYYFHCPSINDESKRKMKQFVFYSLIVCLHALIHSLPTCTWRLFTENKTKFVIIFSVSLFLFWVLSVSYCLFWCLGVSVCLATTSFRCPSINDQNKRIWLYCLIVCLRALSYFLPCMVVIYWK